MAWIRAIGGSTPAYVPDYIYKDGTIMVPIANYPYKGYGDTGNTFNGTVAVDGQYLKLSTQSGGNTGYTSYITDEIDLTNVTSITVYRSSSSGVASASMLTIQTLEDNYVGTTPAVNISSNNTSYTLDTSSLTGKHRFCIKFYRTATTAGHVNFGTIAINKA